MHLRYSFRLYPEPGQRSALARAFGCARVVFNDAVRARRDAYAAKEPYPTSRVLSASLITEAKQRPGRSWLGDVSAVVLQQALRDADTAYANFFASLKGERKGPKIGEPSFRSRRDSRQAVRFTANARWKITEGGRLSLPKIGEVRVKWSRSLPSVPSTVTVIKDAAGRYFASFVIDTDPVADAAKMPAPDPGSCLGIDLGLTHFAVLDDGTKIDSPRFLRRAEKKLKKAQRGLSRKQKGSKNREKARLKAARAHARVADARREFHHQLSTWIIRENQTVIVEDLAVNGLARTRLAKSVHDAGWSQFVAMLEYKAKRYGREFVRIGRFTPTTRTCSACGHLDGPKPLSVREWTCPACDTLHDRDINAAKNVKAAGQCGSSLRSVGKTKPPASSGARHDVKKQEATESRTENRAA
ncbi:RNA-guided endonuclease TnpB family protein [Streptomyces sp. NBC_00063]|uniref:RNA-guided endonuclease InsQ/TnpB family protein n=1 Tax=Streptomyces sp. NBC_00063 TaxID=2975638 RepID=UPI0022594233|nr:RNA-guided endonuclease TnpB family protein [Streptomyces sp. NBC_00063]MCX5441441.1 transposase [Streptomyces sp. NBC_00063]